MSRLLQKALADPSLVGGWRLGESSGTVGADASGHGHPATYANTPTLGVPGAVGGDADTAITLTSAQHEYIEVTTPGYALPQLTVMGWFKAAAAGQYHDLAVMAVNHGWILRVNGATNTLEFLIDLGAGYLGVGAGNLLDGDWHFIAATFDGATQALYKDAVLMSSAAHAGAITQGVDNPSLYIGSKNDEWSDTSADEVFLFSRAFSAAEILAFYTSAPIGDTGGVEYAIEVFASGGTYGPGTLICEVHDALNVGWSRYDRMPGKAFFTLPQTSPLIQLVTPLTLGAIGAPVTAPQTFHIAIWRITTAGAQLVYRGLLIDADDAGDDVVFSAFDYLSLLSLSRTGFKTLYPTKKLGSELIAVEWAALLAQTFTPLGFVTTGVIEDPLDITVTTPIKTNAQFGTLDQSRLQLFYDITEMGRANTNNRVTYEITLANVFNFWKDQGGTATTELCLGGTVSDYRFLPGYTRFRNDLATIGVGATGGPTEIVSVANNDLLTMFGRRQDVVTLKTLAGVGGGTTEADQQKAALEAALYRGTHYPGNLAVQLERGRIPPFAAWAMNDQIPVEIVNGRDSILSNSGMPYIVGVRALYDESGEDLQMFLDYQINLPAGS